MLRIKFNTIVVSDLHLGARNARVEEFLRFLDWVRTDRLILAGDIFDHPEMKGLTRQHVDVLDALRDFGRQADVVWLRGNHDPSAHWFNAVMGIEPRDEVTLDIDGRKYLVYHGHEWDKSMHLPPFIINAADSIYHFCQWLDPTHKLARMLKRTSKSFCRAVKGLQGRAVAEARRRSFAGVILGHSHVAHDARVDDVHYLNCGCWTETPSGFVGIADGRARRFYWETFARRRFASVPEYFADEPVISLPLPDLGDAGGIAAREIA